MSGWHEQARRLRDAQTAIMAAVGQFDSLPDAAVCAVRIAIPWASGSVIEMRDGDDVVYRAASGSTVEGKIGLRLPMLGSLSGRCIQEGEPQLCHDSEIDERVDREACRSTSVRSMVVVPIPFEGSNAGVLKVFSDEANAFDTDDVLTIQLLIAPIAFALASAAQIRVSQDRDVLSQRFQATFDQAAVGMAHADPDGRFLRVNDRFCDLVGRSRDELCRSGFQEITHPDDLHADLEYLAALAAGTIDHFQMEKRYIRSDASTVWISLTASKVSKADGSTDFFVAVIEDISERKMAEGLAAHDALTGLPNRRAMLRRLSVELDALPEAREPIAVAYLDLDRFKQVNDRLGHLAGDQCLVTVSAVIGEAIREHDSLYRMAGDEFVLLLPGVHIEAADGVLARLQNAVAIVAATFGWDIGISVGAVVLAPGTHASVEDVIGAADTLMYGAKKHGTIGRMVERFVAPDLKTPTAQVVPLPRRAR